MLLSIGAQLLIGCHFGRPPAHVSGFYLEQVSAAGSEFGFQDMVAAGFQRALVQQGTTGAVPLQVRTLRVEENPVATALDAQVWEIVLSLEITHGTEAQDAILVQGTGRYTLQAGQSVAGTAARNEAYALLVDRLAVEGVRRLNVMELK